MALTLIKESRYLFGICADKPALPEGFSYVEKEGYWLTVNGPDGSTHFVRKSAHLVKLVVEGDTVSIDESHTIPL